jgi:ABC-type dipeptide/oligopeptide/nickel transport system ATPase component
MKIINFSYSDFRDGWHLKDVQFDDINLLVGLSGVGKTKILRSIIDLKNIANGNSLNGIKWSMTFVDSEKKHYGWSGEFSVINEIYDDNHEKNKPIILSENLVCDEKVLIERKNDQIIYKNKETPRLLPDKSIIYFLKEEPINSIVNEMNKILLYDHTYSIESQQSFSRYDKTKLLKEYKSINDILNSKLNMPIKLFWTAFNDKILFSKIEKLFCDMFPFIEGIRIDILDDSYQVTVPQPLRDIPFIQIKERNIDKWIPQFEISSGMFNALMHLCELYLCAENSVILIDELENSLGLNCLGPISDEIIENTKNTQFIITSHHPTIINSIKCNSWKVVTRNASNVSIDKYSVNTTESEHDPYMQLINSIQYNDGIAK